ncbi:MAG: hypothetical protein DI598_16810 [Pseudopedobacter saltans]|uniref:Uncharacterized protein n=1 Tax=Pseudopedobacter saltans TaxID=151895 RepID=A0A2W5GGU7_9SPHI|nr:MAG: hypothetical protein DI598_16810 [Pseudopedobacter saltans]
MKILIAAFFMFLIINDGFSQQIPSYDSSKLSPLVLMVVNRLDTLSTDSLNQAFHDVSYQQHHERDFDLLKKRGSETELLELTNHSNPYIRINAFQGLLFRHFVSVENVLKNHLKDTGIVILQSKDGGCIYTRMEIIDAMFHSVFEYKQYEKYTDNSFMDSEMLNRIFTLEEKYLKERKERKKSE